MPEEIKNYVNDTMKNFTEMNESFEQPDKEKESKANTKKNYEDLISVPQSAKDAFARKPYYLLYH